MKKKNYLELEEEGMDNKKDAKKNVKEDGGSGHGRKNESSGNAWNR